MCANCGGLDVYQKDEGEIDEYTMVMVLPDSKCMCSQVDRVLQAHSDRVIDQIDDLSTTCSGLKDELCADLAQSGIESINSTLVSLVETNLKEITRVRDAVIVNISEMRVILTKQYMKQAKCKRLQQPKKK